VKREEMKVKELKKRNESELVRDHHGWGKLCLQSGNDKNRSFQIRITNTKNLEQK